MWAAVSFDIDNTLVDRDAAVRALLATRLPPDDVDAAMSVDCSGHMLPSLFRWLADRLPELGPPEAVRRWFVRMVPRGVSEDPRVTAAVRRIARTYRVIVVSNGGAGQRQKLSAAGLSDAFEHVVVSCEVHARKPSAAIFDKAASLLRLPPSSVLHVGDHPVLDISGASCAGMSTCWVSRGRPLCPEPPSPDLVVQHVSELPEVLSC